MNLVDACDAFVRVSDAGSFTAAAGQMGIPQSAASRRVAALERHLGHRVIDRGDHRPTAFGAALLPYARRLAQLADRIERIAEHSPLQPMVLAVPEGCSAQGLALLIQAAEERAIDMEVVLAERSVRADLLRELDVRTAIVPVAPDVSTWTVLLGVARAVSEGEDGVFFLDSIRPRRGRSARGPRLWILPEDDVPHIRDRLYRLRDSVGLPPGQIASARSVHAAALAAFRVGDLVLCTRDEAQRLDLRWQPLGDIHLNRGYALDGADGADVRAMSASLLQPIAVVLGADARER